MTTPTEALHNAETVLNALIDGLRVNDRQLNEHCELALRAIGQRVIPALTVAANAATKSAHRRRLLAAIELVEDSDAQPSDIGRCVWRALSEGLRVSDDHLNAKAIAAFGCFPPNAVFELLSQATYARHRKGYSQRLQVAAMRVGRQGG